MKTSGFNLSTYNYTDNRVKYSLYIFLPLLIIIFTSYNYTSFMSLDKGKEILGSDLSRIKEETTALSKEAREEDAGPPAKKGLTSKDAAKKVGEINAVLERDAFSWSELLYSLETAAPAGLSIKRIKPGYGDKKIRIAGVAKGLGTITTFVDNLQESKYVGKSFLLRQDVELVENRYPAISFEIEAEGDF